MWYNMCDMNIFLTYFEQLDLTYFLLLGSYRYVCVTCLNNKDKILMVHILYHMSQISVKICDSQMSHH